MLTVISPAKRLDWAEIPVETTTPDFEAEAQRLASHARQLSLGNLKSLMGLSDDLARLNRDRFRAFSNDPAPEITRPAMFAFAGDTYQGLEAATMDDAAIGRAQSHLRILSGLYGVLRPLDAIQPYRLEMGSRLKTRRGTSLYAFWGDEVAKSLNRDGDAVGTDLLVNCASQEYFGAVDLKALKLQVITPQFYEVKAGTPKIISFFAKKARGAMARFIIENRVTELVELQEFTLDGYRFQRQASDASTLVFHRDAQDTTKAA